MMNFLAQSYLYRLDPVVIELFGFKLHWYGLAYIAGFVVSWLFIRQMAKTDRSTLTADGVWDLSFYSVLGVMLGGRIGYAAFYQPELFIGFEASLPFWKLLAVHKGGMSSHGGIIGVIAAMWLYAWRNKHAPLHILDLAAFSCLPGLFFGRLANFNNGELWGRPLPVDMQADSPWWSVKYPQELLTDSFRDSPEKVAQLRENLGSIPGGRQIPIDELYSYIQNGNQEIIELVQPVLTAYYPSQLFQAITDGPVLMIILALLWLRPRKPGLIGCSFLMAYGVLRFGTEFFRQPDKGVDLLLGFSRGQILSTLMIVIGAVILTLAMRREAKPLGGLLKRN